MAAGDKLSLSALGTAFFLPLFLSPAVAILLAAPHYRIAHVLTARLRIVKESCLCIAPGQFLPLAQRTTASTLACCAPDDLFVTCAEPPRIDVSVGIAPSCVDKYSGFVFGITAQKVIDAAHYTSAVAVSFARGLNDAPKIVGLTLALEALELHLSMFAVAAVMAIGGLVSARAVAETMGKKISTMNDGQALTANIVSAFLVIFASHLGVPVSTTHVSVGAITGIGVVNGAVNKSVIGGIVMSWVMTLPIAAALSASAYLAYKIIL